MKTAVDGPSWGVTGWLSLEGRVVGALFGFFGEGISRRKRSQSASWPPLTWMGPAPTTTRSRMKRGSDFRNVR